MILETVRWTVVHDLPEPMEDIRGGVTWTREYFHVACAVYIHSDYIPLDELPMLERPSGSYRDAWRKAVLAACERTFVRMKHRAATPGWTLEDFRVHTPEE